jgi:hypothetical protein
MKKCLVTGGAALACCFESLDQTVDPSAGFWGRDAEVGLSAATHVYPFCDYVERTLPSPDVAISTALSLQQPNGSHAYAYSGWSCLRVGVLMICQAGDMVKRGGHE